MKKIISIVFVAMVAILAFSCQKGDIMSDETVQYTFNINVDGQVGFDNGDLTKGGASPSYKAAWASGDRIFLFFKPTSGTLLEDTYATLTYNGSTWGGAVTGTSSLGEGGSLSAVYVYNLDGSVNPAFSDSKWTIATGNVFYNCQTGVSYTVSGSEISASLNLVAPADFVRFSVSGGSSGALTCDKVKGWKDVAIGSDMTFTNVTCTGYMDGLTNIGDSNVMDYYGRLVSGTSLKGVTSNFSVVKSGKVYEHSATPSTEARAFSMITTGWTEVPGKLPGLFSVSDGKQVRFSKGNLWYDSVTLGSPASFNFETNQYDISSSWSASHVGNFYWSKTASVAYASSYSDGSASTSDVLFTNATDTTPNSSFAVNGQAGIWRALSQTEWQYLFANHSYKYVPVNGKYGIVITPDGFSGTIADSYDTSAWATAEAAGFVFLPNTGFRMGSTISETDKSCIYWTSTASTLSENAYRMFLQWKGSYLSTDFTLDGERQWAVGIRLISD